MKEGEARDTRQLYLMSNTLVLKSAVPVWPSALTRKVILYVTKGFSVRCWPLSFNSGQLTIEAPSSDVKCDESRYSEH